MADIYHRAPRDEPPPPADEPPAAVKGLPPQTAPTAAFVPGNDLVFIARDPGRVFKGSTSDGARGHYP